MTDLYIEYGPMVLVVILSGLGLAGSWLIANKIKSSKVAGILLRAAHEIKSAVLMVSNTFVKEAKRLAEDGKLTEADKREAMRIALATMKENLGPIGLAKLARVLGLSSVDKWLTTQAEAVVASMKTLPPPKQ